MELFHICSIAEIVILGQTMHKIIIYLHIHASTAISTRVEVAQELHTHTYALQILTMRLYANVAPIQT